MSIDSHLIHLCRIQRPTTPNRTNLKTGKPTWADHLTSQRCRLVVKAQRVADSVTGERPVVTTYLLMLPAQTDIKPGDRVTDIYDEREVLEVGSDGETAAIFRVSAVLPRRARAQRHVSVQLEKSGGN